MGAWDIVPTTKINPAFEFSERAELVSVRTRHASRASTLVFMLTNGV
jgi:hypothetical protein